jgi:hypothetical protein
MWENPLMGSEGSIAVDCQMYDYEFTKAAL